MHVHNNDRIIPNIYQTWISMIFVVALLVQYPEMRNDVAQLRAVCDIFTDVTLLCFVCLLPTRSLLHKELGLYKRVYFTI